MKQGVDYRWQCNICEEFIEWDEEHNTPCTECGAYFCGDECCGAERTFVYIKKE